MSSENGKTVFEEAAAERELEELRRAIEESRGRRRRANEAFDEFIKGFGEARHAAHAETDEPDERNDEPNGEPNDDSLFAFAPAPAIAAAGPVTPPKPATQSPLDDFAHEGLSTESSPLRSIPAALAPARRSPARGIVPVVAIAVVGVLAAFLLWRGRSQEESAPPAAVTAPSPAAAPRPHRLRLRHPEPKRRRRQRSRRFAGSGCG